MINVLFFFLAAYFVKEANPHHERLDEVIKELSEDVDTDVRAFLQIPQMYDSDGEPINDVSVSQKKQLNYKRPQSRTDPQLLRSLSL